MTFKFQLYFKQITIGIGGKEKGNREREWNESPDNNKVNSYCYCHGITWWCCFCCCRIVSVWRHIFGQFHITIPWFEFALIFLIISLSRSLLPSVTFAQLSFNVCVSPLETSVYIALLFLLTFGKYSHTCYLKHTHSNTNNNALSLLFALHPRALLKTFPCHAFWPYKYTHTHTSVVVNLKLSNSKTQADYLIFICRPLMKALHLPLT